jgi:hypothetical protein
LLQKTQNGAPYFWRKVGMEKNIQDIGHDWSTTKIREWNACDRCTKKTPSEMCVCLVCVFSVCLVCLVCLVCVFSVCV